MTNVPTVVAHADWSILPVKRWVATAHLRGDGYVADAPRSVGDARRLIASLVPSPSAIILAGFDFPIGVPTAYARAAGVRHFRALLDGLGAPPWDEFAKPARERWVEVLASRSRTSHRRLDQHIRRRRKLESRPHGGLLLRRCRHRTRGRQEIPLGDLGKSGRVDYLA